MTNTLVSILLPVKNAMPNLVHAVEAIRSQSYKNFELIVQDSVSTDGTLDYLESLQDFPEMKLESELDTGFGDAYQRAMVRSRGEFICFTAADECLLKNSITNIYETFQKYPNAAAIFGGVLLIDQEGKKVQHFIPKSFDFDAFMRCNYFPSFGGLFNRKVIGDDFYYDPSLKMAPDYDFWLRLGRRFTSKELIDVEELFNTACVGEVSSSYRAENFTRFCHDKCFVLDRFLENYVPIMKREGLRNEAQEGIFAWATRQCVEIEGVTQAVIEFSKNEQKFYQKSLPRRDSLQATNKDVTLEVLQTSSKKPCVYPLPGKGGNQSWGYFYRLHFEDLHIADDSCYWIEIKFKVISGAIGVCLMEG